MFLLSTMFSWNHIHPILVHFTTALLPVSVLTDAFGKFTNRYALTPTAWWMLFYGALATPLTALAGWLWAGDLAQMTGGQPDPVLVTHQWLGIGLIGGFLFLAIWRGRVFIRDKKPDIIYFIFAGLILAALMYQGYLGGKMTLG